MNKLAIHLNGCVYGIIEIKIKLTESLPDWERDIFVFLLDWFSTSKTIQVLTSGSTGVPKTIQREKKHLVASAKMTGKFFDFRSSQTALLCLPAKYIAGKMMLVRAIEWGLELDYIEPKIALEIPEREYHFSAMTPQQIEATITQISRIETIIIGGAPISKSLEGQLTLLSNQLYATYGMTETVSHIALRKLTKEGNETYTALPGVSLSVNSESCLIISAPTLLDHTITTTDIVQQQDSNSFNWMGRADFVINSGGIKVSPEKMEGTISHLISNPFFFYGKPDEKWGQKVMLIIEGQPFNTDKLKVQINSFLTTYQIPKEIIFVSKFIRTENGKLNRIASAKSENTD